MPKRRQRRRTVNRVESVSKMTLNLTLLFLCLVEFSNFRPPQYHWQNQNLLFLSHG